MAIDFFTVETVRLKTLYVLFLIELHTRRVRLAGVTDHPNGLWQECLDWMLIWGRRHLERVLDEYVQHYNDERPHRGLALRPPRVSRFGLGLMR